MAGNIQVGLPRSTVLRVLGKTSKLLLLPLRLSIHPSAKIGLCHAPGESFTCISQPVHPRMERQECRNGRCARVVLARARRAGRQAVGAPPRLTAAAAARASGAGLGYGDVKRLTRLVSARTQRRKCYCASMLLALHLHFCCLRGYAHRGTTRQGACGLYWLSCRAMC